MRKALPITIIFLLLTLTLTQLAAADFTVANDSNTKVKVIYGYFDPSQEAWRIKGYYHINPGASRQLKVPDEVDTVFARIWTASEVVAHDRPSGWTWAVHPRKAFEVVYKHEERIVLQSNVPSEELMASADFYEYTNNATFRYQPGNGSVNIFDRYLRAAIANALGKARGAKITPADMLRLRRLQYNEYDGHEVGDIHLLTGLEFAKNLIQLYLDGHKISDLSPLTGLTNLTALQLQHNEISDVSPLAGLINLTWLMLYDNEISDVSPLANLNNLTDLVLSHNKISDFSPIAGLIPNLARYGKSNQDVPADDGGDGRSDGVAEDVLQPVNIPDPDLRAAIEKKLGKASGAVITQSDMLTLTSLEAENAGIEDLIGIELATNLTELLLRINQISDVSPLTHLKKLETLFLGDNQIADISPIAELKNLDWLLLGDNQIADISPIAELKKMGILSLDDNQIVDISPIAELKNLSRLYLDDNQIADISPVAELKNLSQLHLRGNQIADISPIAELKNLGTLDLGDTQIADISPIAELKNLRWLSLYRNQIADISPLAGLTNLQSLYLNYNQISDFSPIAGLIPNLRSYENSNQRAVAPAKEADPNAPGNIIPDPNLRAAIAEALGKADIVPPSVRSDIEEALGKTIVEEVLGEADSITVAEIETLTSLEAERADIQDLTGLEFAINLTALYLPGNQIADLSPLTQLKKLKVLKLRYNKLSDVSPLAQVKSLVELDLGGNQLSDISPLSQLKQLTWLYLSRNQIVDVFPLAHLTNLTALYLSYNQIADFSALAALVKRLERYQNDNQTPTGPNAPVTLPDPNLRAAIEEALGKTKGATITQADMQTLTRFEAEERDVQNLTGIEFAENLEELYIIENEISDISPLTHLKNLKHLELAYNPISDISPLAPLKNLEFLFLANGQISDISLLAQFKQLRGLNIYNSQLSDISPLTHLKQLTLLAFSGIQVSDWSALANLKNLETLYLSDSQLSDISPLAHLRDLTRLSLDENQISDVSPLAHLKNLKFLNLYDNQISDISPLAGLTNLTWLNLGSNQISDVSPLAGLTNLTELHLFKNRISDFAPIAELVKNLRSYENGAQLKSLFPDSVRISGPRTVTSVVKDYTFTATVKNVSAQGLPGIKVTVDGGETVYTNGVGQAEFKLNFPSVGTHYTVLTFRDEATQSEFKDGFEVEVLEPHSIELVKDRKEIQINHFYTANFVVRSADGQALEGFQVKLNVGKWVFETIGTAQVPIPTILRTTQHAVELLRDDDPNSPIKNLNVFGWRVKSVASDRFNTVTTNSKGRAICSQRLLSTGFYGVSATVMLDGQELLTTSFSAGNAPNLKIIQPGTTLSLDDQNAYYRVTGGWKRLRNPRAGAATLWGVRDIREYPPVDPPSYRVEVGQAVSCGASVPEKEILEVAWKLYALAPPSEPTFINSLNLTADESTINLKDDTTTSLDPTLRWTTSDTVAVDVGIPVVTVRFLDGTEEEKKRAKALFRRWTDPPEANLPEPNLHFIFSDEIVTDGKVPSDMKSDIRVTFNEVLSASVLECPRSCAGISTIGKETFVPMVTNYYGFEWLDRLGAALFDWGAHQSYELEIEKANRSNDAIRHEPTMGIHIVNDRVLLHEIGHAIGFYHPHQITVFAEVFEWPPKDATAKQVATDELGDAQFEVRQVPEDTASVDPESVMTYAIPPEGLVAREGAPAHLANLADGTGISVNDDLSAGDLLAAANVYGKRSEISKQRGVRRVAGTIYIDGVDDEAWDDETINVGHPVEIYVATQTEYSYSFATEFKWGGECRVEVDIGARQIAANGDIEMSAKARLYEGSYEETDDLEDEDTIYFTVSPGEFTDESVTVRNRGFGGGDHATVTFRLAAPIIAEAIGGAPESPSIDIASSDVNGDGQVDAADLVLVSNYIEQTGSIDPRVDVNSDGIVTIADLVQVAQYLGQSIYASAPSPVIVPMGLKYATVNGWIDQARVEDDGSLVFHQGIAKLEYLLTLIIPEETALLHNYPNPFNPETWIPYHLAEPADVTLTIYAVDGKVVRRLDLGHQAGGYYQSKSRAAYWDGRNTVGERVASGIYFYTLTAGGFSATQKMLIMK